MTDWPTEEHRRLAAEDPNTLLAAQIALHDALEDFRQAILATPIGSALKWIRARAWAVWTLYALIAAYVLAATFMTFQNTFGT